MDTISFDDFSKVDIRIGTVVKADVPEWSHWVMRLEIEIGDRERKICFSGISKFFTPEDLTGKQFPFVINLAPKKIGPDKELSEAMMIMATPEDPTSLKLRGASEDVPPVLFKLQKKVPNGTKVC